MAVRLELMEKVDTIPRESDDTRPYPIGQLTVYKLTEKGKSENSLPIWDNVQQVLHPVSPETRRAYSQKARKRKKERKEELRRSGLIPPRRGTPVPPSTEFLDQLEEAE